MIKSRRDRTIESLKTVAAAAGKTATLVRLTVSTERLLADVQQMISVLITLEDSLVQELGSGAGSAAPRARKEVDVDP